MLTRIVPGRRVRNMKCLLCERQAVTDLCEYHKEAKARLESAFGQWKTAYGKMEWKDYLERVARNDQAGAWAVEVARLMLGAEQ